MKNSISKLRRELGFNQQQFAAMIGISRPYLSDIENDKKNPSCTIADRIAKALDRPFDEIFFSEGVHHDVHKRL